MSMPAKRMPLLTDGRGREPRGRCSRSCLCMRGRVERLRIPFELRAPGEGATLSPEDDASAPARRPSPGSRLPLPSLVVGEDEEIIQAPLLDGAPRAGAR